MRLIRTSALAETGMPGNAVLVALRKLVLLGVGLSLAYGVLANAQQRSCPDSGALLGDGTRQCLDATMRPLPLIFIVLAGLLYSAISRVSKRVESVADALLVIERRARAMTIVVVGSLVIGHVWFWTLPQSLDLSRGLNVMSPFLFVLADVSTYSTPLR